MAMIVRVLNPWYNDYNKCRFVFVSLHFHYITFISKIKLFLSRQVISSGFYSNICVGEYFFIRLSGINSIKLSHVTPSKLWTFELFPFSSFFQFFFCLFDFLFCAKQLKKGSSISLIIMFKSVPNCSSVPNLWIVQFYYFESLACKWTVYRLWL